MSTDPEKNGEAAPSGREFADVESTMDPRRQHPDGMAGPGERLIEELIHWDELPAERLAALASDPAQAPRLELLRRLETFLHGATRAPEACPTAEELYDFGRGPGYEPLAFERRRAIAGHIDHCAECAGHVRSLAASPPLPLDVSPPTDSEIRRGPAPAASASRSFATRREEAAGPFAAAEAAAASRPQPEPAPPRDVHTDPFAEPAIPRATWGADRPEPHPELGPHWIQRAGPASPRTPWGARRRLHAVLATAAAAGLLALIWTRDRGEIDPTIPGTLPEPELLRGEAGGPLYFPRGTVLLPPVDLDPSVSRIHYAEKPLFELEPVEGATLYRVILLRHDGGAFAEGREIEVLEEKDPAKLFAGRPLGPGSYTWEAWVIVDGLDRQLGARDFQVVEDDALCHEIEGLDQVAAIRLLHERKYLTDARALARKLPASPEREAYLRVLPGR